MWNQGVGRTVLPSKPIRERFLLAFSVSYGLPAVFGVPWLINVSPDPPYSLHCILYVFVSVSQFLLFIRIPVILFRIYLSDLI